MKSLYLSLTFLFAFLPALFPTFNIYYVGGKNETLSKNSKSPHVTVSPSQQHSCIFHNHKVVQADSKKPIAFGEDLGRFIREKNAIDANYRIKTVVIDPGHGGKDPGCSGTNTKEKEIALKIALQLGRTLQQHYPEVQFIYTRQSDVFVPLNRRAKIANENNADLFISIHCNYFPHSSKPKGSETYVLGLHRAKDNLEVAKRENSSIFYEDNYKQTYDGYDPNSTEGHIILSMFQNAFLEQSILFANKIEKNIKDHTQQRSRGVKQAGFLVLRKTTMPSVLVETGYLSNAKDNSFLDSQNGKTQIVNAIADAFSEYKREVEDGSNSIVPQVYATTTAQRNNLRSTIQKRPQTASAPVQMAPQKPVQRIKKEKNPTRLTAKSGVAYSPNQLSKQSLLIPDNPPVTPNTSSRLETSEAPIEYKVLLRSSPRLIDTDQGEWNKVPYSVQVIRDGKSFKYLAMGFSNFEEAVSAKSKLRKIGFNEAFLVAYQNGKRIDIKVAMSKTGVR